MSLVKNIENDNWTKNYSYYDTKGRVIGTHSINHLGGYTRTESDLDFAGVALQTKTYHKRLSTDTEKIITETFEYDHQNRLKKHYHQVDSQPQELLTDNSYNELSQLTNKKVGNNLQSIDYAYNIRGWMTKINDPSNLNGKLFGYEMRYTNPVNTGYAPARYNGNIAEVDWQTSNDNVLKRYSYSYYSQDRLMFGHYSEPGSTIPQSPLYDEYLEYDLNGNITFLSRNSKNTNDGSAINIDALHYNYTGNRLNSVTDSTQNFEGYRGGGNTIAYDSNGNMKNNVDKGMLQIDYNHLNLPSYIKFNRTLAIRGSGPINENTNYLYRSDGSKLRKIYNYAPPNPLDIITQLSSKVTEYLDGFQYEGTAKKSSSIIGVTLQFVPTSEGYYDFVKNKYIYNYTDHLGNVRLSYMNNGSGTEILEESNYYPFGLKHEGYNQLTGNPVYQYKYNGKELQETGMYDYGARFYMPDIGRWGVIDPLAEKYRRHSPYNYAVNNPMRYIDPDGRFIIDPNATKEQRAIIQRAINMAKMLLKDEKVLRAMMNKGNLSRSQIMNDFTDGKGPLLTLSKDLFGRAFGQYTPNGKGSGKFEINAITTDNASEFSEESQLNVIFLLAATIMHEDVHRGNDAAGFNEHEEGVEQGEAFEQEAFGESVQYSNSESIRTRFSGHFKKVVSSKLFKESMTAKEELRKYEEKKEKDKIDVKKRLEENILKSKQ